MGLASINIKFQVDLRDFYWDATIAPIDKSGKMQSVGVVLLLPSTSYLSCRRRICKDGKWLQRIAK
jgi:hypothetical protein